VAALRRVYPDTNVCFPISLLDLILRMDEAGLHRVLWTEDLLAELVRVWVARGARSHTDAERVAAGIRRTFPNQEVPRAEYEGLIVSMPGRDADDHRHSAAAVARAPCVLLTSNLKDFPAAALARRNVQVTTADDYLVEATAEGAPDLALLVVEMAAARRRPPMTSAEVLTRLERAGVPRFARAVRDQLRI
jgi:hypothetical protein